MNKTYYEKYKSLAFDLAKTLVIKSSASANAINLLLTLKFGSNAVDANNPASWKYYLNLSGQYHTSDLLDIEAVNTNIGIVGNKITIKSLDTLLDITLDSSSTLDTHPNTKTAYVYGTRYYDALLAKYPAQEQLIIGLLSPVDINSAILAEDGSILSYYPDLVEAQEITLIADLEAWIKSMLIRWHINAFMITDSLYSTAQHAILYMYLVPTILNLRLARCKTAEAHSFHIKVYLAGHENLDRFYPYLTHKQALWLYRNIDRVVKYSGHTATFDWLVQNILSNRNIPLDGLTIYQQKGFNDSGLSNYSFIRKPVGSILSAASNDITSLTTVLAKEDKVLPGNVTYNANMLGKINNDIQDTNVGVRLTKVLDSSMLDTTDETRYTLTDELFNHWIYMAATDKYAAIVNFKDPINSNIVTLSVKDAFVYIIFLMDKAFKRGLTQMPSFTVGGITRDKTFTAKSLYPNNASVNVKTILNNAFNAHTPIVNQRNVLGFYNLVNNFYKNKQIYQDIVAKQQHHVERGLIEIGLDKLTFNTTVEFKNADGTPIVFATWLLQNNIVDGTYTNEQIVLLIDAVTTAVTGFKLDPTTMLKNIQAAMVGIMKQLSSYTVQFLSSINASGIKPIRWAAIRVGDINTKGAGKAGLAIANIKPVNVNSLQRLLVAYDIHKPYVDYGWGLSLAFKSVGTLPIQVKNLFTELKVNSKFNTVYKLSSGKISLTLGYAAYNPLVSNTTSIVGYETFLALTPVQQSSILSIY